VLTLKRIVHSVVLNKDGFFIKIFRKKYEKTFGRYLTRSVSNGGGWVGIKTSNDGRNFEVSVPLVANIDVF